MEGETKHEGCASDAAFICALRCSHRQCVGVVCACVSVFLLYGGRVFAAVRDGSACVHMRMHCVVDCVCWDHDSENGRRVPGVVGSQMQLTCFAAEHTAPHISTPCCDDGKGRVGAGNGQKSAEQQNLWSNSWWSGLAPGPAAAARLASVLAEAAERQKKTTATAES